VHRLPSRVVERIEDHEAHHLLGVSPMSDLDRREMMKLLAAGAALATGSLGGCMSKPKERIMPRVEQPPEMTPGLPLEYATAMVLDGFATGLVVKTHEARPTKIEGNPDHPASLGGTNAYHQASVLELYDPERPKAPIHDGLPTTTADVLRAIAGRERMAGLWFLLHPQSSPLVAEQIAKIKARHPGARFAYDAPIDRRAVYRGAMRAFGQALECQYHFDRADIVMSLDADFMSAMPNATRWARDFAKRRRPPSMSRLYVAEPKPSPTGSLADHRLPIVPSRVLQVAHALLSALQSKPLAPDLSAAEQRWVTAAVADLTANRGRALVVVGDRQPEQVHELGHAINEAIGAFGATLDLTQPALLEPLGDGLEELVRAVDTGAVQTLVLVETNPVYTSPGFGAALMRVRETIAAAQARHETGAACRTFLPLSHYLEAWGDARAYDGTLSVVQPVIRPMYDSVGVIELLAAFAGDADTSAHDLVRARYSDRLLQRGAVPDSAFAPVPPPRSVAPAPVEMPRGHMFELSFEVSPAVYDGRFANISWLQELPKPGDKVTWGNVATLAPATARQLGIQHEDVVLVTAGDQSVVLPAYVLPGHAERCITLELGYGRAAAGSVGNHVGVNVYSMRGKGNVTARATGKQARIAATQTVFDQHDRHIAVQLAGNQTLAPKSLLTMLPAQFEDTPKWKMTIDMTLCTGCSACVVACVAENNIPVVGKAGVIANREMHWIRIDTYRDEAGTSVHQPMLCQHCEDAPCEYVCPTYATQHSPDGLNEMVYNRCIGTRFCSNNCPYKVRRFNWFDYTEDTAKPLRLQRNPNVTVRARGVMEKCTYCVQRIRSAEIESRKQHRDIRPGEVVTACQQACPTGAIDFGLSTHDNVIESRKQPRTYFVLEELGTRPSTAYLAKVSNKRE
jgi:molybdopterin-containing oxidoreductase family iron-sulfur binding subunit